MDLPSPKSLSQINSNESVLAMQPLHFWQNWVAVRYMFRNYPIGLDAAWDAEVRGRWRRVYKRFVEIPSYLAFRNEGYSLRLNQKLIGLLYLQHPPLVTHINDIEVNAQYRGRGYSYFMLDFAETRARALHKKYMTLAVTLTNKRAFNIYIQNGFLEQHDRYFQLNRRWWSESKPTPLTPSAITTQRYQLEVNAPRPYLKQLGKAEATANLLHFFRLETEVTNPLTGEVWLEHYPPTLPTFNQGRSFGLTLGSEIYAQSGHADLFEYDDWVRWRLWLNPSLWDVAALKALLETLIAYIDGSKYITMTVAFGSLIMHERAQKVAHELSLQERFSERTLMIKLL